MALPANVPEELAQRQARLRLVPPDEAPPPAEVREQVRTWQEHVGQIADTIRWVDETIERLQALPELGGPERDQLELLRSGRAEAFAVMQRLNPDQAWFWTEEWQAGEREADADEAAGRTTYHASTEDFLAALDAHLDDEIESDAVARHADA